MAEIENRVVEIASLKAHPRNYRRHPQMQVQRLAASVARFGQVRSIVVQQGPKGYLIVAGHGLVQAAKTQGLTQLRADIIPADWTPEQVEGYLVADNLHSDGADDDRALLAEILREQQHAGFDLASVGMSDDELDAFIEALADEQLAGSIGRDIDDPDGGGDDFDATPDEGPTRCQPGDLWQLGRHRLLCGDSTRRDDVARLMGGDRADVMWTDPPYHVGKDFGTYDEGNEWDALMQNAWLACASEVLKPGAQRYICFAQARSREAILAYEPKRLLVWCKPFALMRSNSWDWAYEFVAWCYDGDTPAYFDKPDGTASFDWQEIASVIHGHEGRYHITQKPTALPTLHIGASSRDGDIVYEPFCGSGTTLVACERLDRRCYAVEIDPHYCDVILRRWEAETGREAVLLSRQEVGEDGAA